MIKSAIIALLLMGLIASGSTLVNSINKRTELRALLTEAQAQVEKSIQQTQRVIGIAERAQEATRKVLNERDACKEKENSYGNS